MRGAMGTFTAAAPMHGDTGSIACALAILGREVLFLRECRALPYREVAETMGISLSAAKQLLFRARQDLRARYLALGGEPLEG